MGRTIEVPDVQVPEDAIIDIPEGLNPSQNKYWLFLLKQFEESDYTLMIDRRIVDEFEEDLQRRVERTLVDVVRESNTLLTGRHGERVVKGWGTRFDRVLQGGVVSKKIELMESWKVGFWKRKGWQQDPAERKMEWTGGGWSLEDIHVGNKGKLFLMKDEYRDMPRTVFQTDIGSRGRWRWTQAGQFPYFLSQLNEEDLMLFYRSYWSCTEIRRELIRRGANLDIPEYLKPEVDFKYVMDIQNAEWRRTVMQISNVKNFPEPIAEDEEGVLYRLDNETNVLKVTCPSTGRVYHLGVPRRFETPKEARRWTLRLPEGVELIAES